MTKKNDAILKVLHVVSWIAFIGLCIEAGALIFNFVYALFKPIASHNIYKGLDLSEMYTNHFPQFKFLPSTIFFIKWFRYIVVPANEFIMLATPCLSIRTARFWKPGVVAS